MKLQFQADRGRRTIQLFTRGIRRVVVGDRECWTTYTIIPRAAMVAGVRRLRANGRQYHDCDWWKLISGMDRWIAPGGYGGPGRAFSNDPHRMRSSRRYVVYAQSGGLDV